MSHKVAEVSVQLNSKEFQLPIREELIAIKSNKNDLNIPIWDLGGVSCVESAVRTNQM